MLLLKPEVYFKLLSALAQCKTLSELRVLEAEIERICNTEVIIASNATDVRNATFTLMIEKITSLHGMKLKQFSDEQAQASLNKWTFWLMIGTFAMVVVSAVSTVLIYFKK